VGKAISLVSNLITLLNSCYTALHKGFNVKVASAFSFHMLLLTVIVVIALVAWALRLMEQAIKSQEFSFMLAGFLVASSAVAMMTVYFLMSNYVLYMDRSLGGSAQEVMLFSESDTYDYLQSLANETTTPPFKY